MTTITSPSCPCGSGLAYQDCCAPFIAGEALPPSAEALMRSRYCAYVQENETYLLATWHPQTRPISLSLDQEPRPRWLGLVVKATLDNDADHASVEFVARYKVAGRAHRMHETSRFERIQGRWVYVDGQLED